MNFQGRAASHSIKSIEFYSTIHKGLRRVLYGTSMELACADPDSDSEVTEALDQLNVVLKLAVRLGGVETVRIHGFLEATHPGATEAAQADSVRQAAAIEALLRLEREIRAAGLPERAEFMADLNASFSGFVGEVLLHMADAELELMPLLRESGSTEELLTIQRLICEDLAADTMAALVSEILPAIGSSERAGFLTSLHQMAPEAQWRHLRAAMSTVLS